MNLRPLLLHARSGLYVVACALGFAVPWDRWADLDAGRTSWLALAALPARQGWMSFSDATVAVLLLGIVCAVSSAWLRTAGTVHRANGSFQRALGTMVHTLALAMLMPPSGALFAMVFAGLLQFLPETVDAGGLRERWGRGILTEAYYWGVAGSFLVLGWRYNAFLLLKCVVISFGASLVVRAFGTVERPGVVEG